MRLFKIVLILFLTLITSNAAQANLAKKPAAFYVNDGIAKSWFGDKHGAIFAATSAVLADSSFGPAYSLRAENRDVWTDSFAVKKDCDRAIELGVGSSTIYFLRATAKYLMGDRKGAVADMIQGEHVNDAKALRVELLSLNSRRVSAPLYLCRAMEAYDYDSKIASLFCMKSLKLDPHYALALAFRGVLDCDEAYVNFKRIGAPNLTKAISDCDAALKADPRCAFAVAERAELKRKQLDVDSFGAFKKLGSERSTAMTEYSKELKAAALVQNNSSYLSDATTNGGTVEEAPTPFYDEHVKNSTNPATPLPAGYMERMIAEGTLELKLSKIKQQRGLLAQKVVDSKKAIIFEYEKALALNTRLTSCYQKRGLIKMELNDYAGAIPEFTHVIKSNSRFDTVFVQRADCEFKVLNFEAAKSDLSKAMKLNEQREKFGSDLEKLYATGTKVTVLTKKTSRHAPENDNVTYVIRRAIVEFWMSDRESALKDLSLAIRVMSYDPNHRFQNEYCHLLSDTYTSRGDVLAVLGQFSAAKVDYSKAVSLNLKSSKALFNRGFVQNLTGNYQDSANDYKQALETSKAANELLPFGSSDEPGKDFSLFQVKDSPLAEIQLDYCSSCLKGISNLCDGENFSATSDFSRAERVRPASFVYELLGLAYCDPYDGAFSADLPHLLKAKSCFEKASALNLSSIFAKQELGLIDLPPK